jgi:hypothetical protein
MTTRDGLRSGVALIFPGFIFDSALASLSMLPSYLACKIPILTLFLPGGPHAPPLPLPARHRGRIFRTRCDDGHSHEGRGQAQYYVWCAFVTLFWDSFFFLHCRRAREAKVSHEAVEDVHGCYGMGGIPQVH